MATFEIKTAEGVHWVEVLLENDDVRCEAGAMRYYRGNIQMESKGPGGVGGFLKAAVSGESAFKPLYRGTGKLVLEPSFHGFMAIQLSGHHLILDRGAYVASDGEIEVTAIANKAGAALLSGEGLFQTSVKGTGTIIVQIPGPVEIIDLVNDRLVVDGSFAVARTDILSFTVEKSTKSMLGSMTSGEGLVNVIQGTGRVWLCPIPFKEVLYHQMFASVAAAASARRA